MYTANEILSKVNEYINNLTYDRKPQSLYEPIKYVLSLGGKRIRPTLMLLSYNLFKDDPETILSPACALETYHNYTLLHDDLMDDAPLRRGQQTVPCALGCQYGYLIGRLYARFSFRKNGSVRQ